MTNNPYGGPGSTPGQPPMGGGPTGPGGPQYGQVPSGPNLGNDGRSPLAKVLSSDSDLPQPVRQLQLAALVSAAGYLVMQILTLIVSSIMLSGYAQMGFEGLVGAGAAFTIVGLIMGLGLYALVIFPLLGGKNWGRILGIVFAILGGLSGLINLFSSFGIFTLSAGLDFVSLLAAVVQVGTSTWYLMFAFRADVAAWYAPQTQYGFQQSWGPNGPNMHGGGQYQYGPAQNTPPGPYPGGYGAGPQGPGRPYDGPAGPAQPPGGQDPYQEPPPPGPSH